MMNILIVEDTQEIGHAMAEYLDACGYHTTLVETLADCYKQIRSHHFDCVVMDWMLPDGEGVQACQEIKSYKNIPVIMETAKGQIEDKIEGFNYGADDYLTKPFDLQELDLRIKAITKRQPLGDIRHWKDLVIDLGKQEIFKKGKRIAITNKEFLIVELLINNNGNIASRTDILEEVWGEDAIREEDNKLDVYISNIRRKLGKSLIETIKGHGYKISM